MASLKLTTQPPPISFSKISFPRSHILLVTLSRPQALNCINTAGNEELEAIWTWLDNEPSLRVGIVTGEGRAFCAGADLKEWNTVNQVSNRRPTPSPGGFGGLSTRSGKKPIIAAVNGICFGGGCEMIINTDIVIASTSATFGLPEVKRGVVAIAGALPRLVRTVGKQRAMEMALTGRVLKAEEAREWGMVNRVVAADDLLNKAISLAEEIAGNSPDSVIVSREGIKIGWEGLGAQAGTEKLRAEWYRKMDGGENMREGLMAFVQKRKPSWVDSKL
ncbi:hypothetical protein MMC19_005257 [Ptychographa xylographoides]|nr:hypothetical protein [Ptychographa xylographoides]